MRLRPARPADAPAPIRFLGDWVRETGWMPLLHSRAGDEAFLRGLIGEAGATVAVAEGTMGFLALAGEEVPALYLAPGAPGAPGSRGIGRALLSSARAGRGRLTLGVFAADPRARAFHPREGFAVPCRTGGGRNEEGLPDLLMTWEAGR